MPDLRRAVAFPVVVPAVAAVVLLAQGVSLLPLPELALVALSLLALVGGALLLLRGAVQRRGSLREAVGLARPRLLDAPIALGWVALAFAAQTAAVLLTIAVTPWDDAQARNVPDLDGITWLGTAYVVLVVGVLAPVVEEVLFRGVLLHALLERWSFWPAALLTSVLFGGMHFVGAISGGHLVVVATTTFGIVLALLVRRTGRLFPAMLTHAAWNLIAVGVALGG